MAFFLGENQYRGQPTLSYCKQYSAQYGLPPDRVFLDYGAQYGAWETLFTYVYPYLPPSGELTLPWEAVLDGKNLEYFYALGAGPHKDVNAALNELLSQ